jgi:hypothetical protein
MPELLALQARMPLVLVWLVVTVIAAGVTAGSLWLVASRRGMPPWWTRLMRWSLVAVMALALADASLHRPAAPTGLPLLVRFATATAGILLATAILRAPAPAASRRGWTCVVAGVATLALSGVRLQAVAAPERFDGDPTAASMVAREHDEHGAHALTDRGSTIPLGRFVTIEHEAFVPDGFNGRVIVADANRSPANCHGWVFTGGRFQVAGTDVARILAENGYLMVADPQPGDLVVYRDSADTIIHTGLVKATGPEGFVLVESKWGPLDIYWHTPHDQVYSQQFEYRRSARHGHELTIIEPPRPPGDRAEAADRQPAALRH